MPARVVDFHGFPGLTDFSGVETMPGWTDVLALDSGANAIARPAATLVEFFLHRSDEGTTWNAPVGPWFSIGPPPAGPVVHDLLDHDGVSFSK